MRDDIPPVFLIFSVSTTHCFVSLSLSPSETQEMSISTNEFVQENDGSDSEANSDDGSDYYQPISAVEDEDDDDTGGISIPNDVDRVFDSLSSENPSFQGNGYVGGVVEREMYTLDLNDDEDEERIIEATDSAISRAFSEDESRRNAPLTPENSMRIMDAMRGISLEGFAPAWINQVPEDRWIDQLRRLRQQPPPPPPTTTTTTTQN